MSINKNSDTYKMKGMARILFYVFISLSVMLITGCSLSVNEEPESETFAEIPQELEDYSYNKTRSCNLETKYLTVNSLQIAYYETKGKGPAILLLHGNSTSKEVFKKQLYSLLGFYLRIVAIDLPGHGESDHATDPFTTYTALGYTDLLVQVVEQLDLHDAVFVGWSLGGHIILEASQQLPYAKGFLIYGTPPIAFPPAPDAFLPNPALMYGFTPVLTEEQANEYVAAMFRPDASNIPGFFAENVMSTDPMARGAIGMAMATGAYTDEIEIVGNLTTPIAILHGENDQLVNGAYIESLNIPSLWFNSIQQVPYAGHSIQWETPCSFNALLYGFVFYVNYLN